jgi:exodeoxyribonuclease VII large subunit
VRADLVGQVMEQGQRLFRGLERMLAERRTRLDGLARGLPDPRHLLEQATQRLDDWSERLGNAVLNFVTHLGERLARLPEPQRALAHLVRAREHELAATAARFRREPFYAELARHARDTARMGERLGPALRHLAERSEERSAALGHRLENLSYKRVLARGFALVRDSKGEAVTRRAATEPGMAVALEFQDGAVGATIAGASALPSAAGDKPERPRKGKDEQGTLL